MIKSIKILSLVMFSISLIGCGTGKKGSSEAKNNNFYDQVLNDPTTLSKESDKAEPNGKLKEKVGSWVKEGLVCYGLVVATNKDGREVYARPVKARIIKIEDDRIKMETLEDINLGEKGGCSKMNFTSGSTWWETAGEIFKDRQDAIEYLKKRKLLNR